MITTLCWLLYLYFHRQSYLFVYLNKIVHYNLQLYQRYVCSILTFLRCQVLNPKPSSFSKVFVLWPLDTNLAYNYSWHIYFLENLFLIRAQPYSLHCKVKHHQLGTSMSISVSNYNPYYYQFSLVTQRCPVQC